MKRKSNEHIHGAIAKTGNVPKVPLCDLPLVGERTYIRNISFP
jgi:hypothetical protein